MKVELGGIDATTINGMSGGWSYTLNLATAKTGVSLFRTATRWTRRRSTSSTSTAECS